MATGHYSVLLHETIDLLNIRPDGVYFDGTAGGGGHTLAIAERLTTGRIIAADKDEAALPRVRARLAAHADKLTLVHDDFRNIGAITAALELRGLDGVVLDLGVSSYQLDEADRGFSYQHDAPLDMRMDRGGGLTAAELVNERSEEELADILFRFGEEKFSRQIAARIVEARQKKRIETTTELAELIKSAIPAAARRDGPHPAKRSFQAIRIAVNGELELLEGALRDAVACLAPGGRIAVITFHSLEDRIVKRTFADLATACHCPPGLPVCVCGGKAVVRLVNSKPVLPSEQELNENPRSRSAKLRATEKL